MTLLKGLFKNCTCGHIEEDHAMDAPEGEHQCNAEGCNCEQFEEAGEIETRKSFAEGHGITFGTGEEAIDWLKQE